MRRTALLLGIAALVATCATPAPSPTAAPSLAPTATTSVSPTRAPAPTEAPTVRPAPTETAVKPDESDDPEVPPLEVDWGAAPAFPSPVLVVGKARVRAIGESGCPMLIYEPADDQMGRSAQQQIACTENPVLSFTQAVDVTAGAPLGFESPRGWLMGAQVVYETDPYGPFWIIEAERLTSRPATATTLAATSIDADGWVEIGRGDGFRLDALDALAPDESGDYLVSVQAQIGQVPSKWRTYGRTYYYWVRVP